MYELIYSQGDMFIVSLIMGMGMGFTYDLLRALRRNIAHGSISINLEDIIYWLFWTWVFIDNIFKFNDGSFRIYIFVVAITGLLIYKNTIGRGVFLLTFYILYSVKKCLEIPKKMLKNGVFWGKINLSIFRNMHISKKENAALVQPGETDNEHTDKKKKI